MNARVSKKSAKHNRAVALAPSLKLPAEASSNRVGIRINPFPPSGEKTKIFWNHQEDFRTAFEAVSKSTLNVRYGLQGITTEYAVTNKDGQTFLYFIPSAVQAELDGRIEQLFVEYSDRQKVSIGYQSVEHIKPASRIEAASLLAKHEAVINKIFAASDWYDALTICKGAGFSEINPSAQPNRWKRDGKVFALRRGKTDVYPAYAFGDDFRPLPAMKDVLLVFKDKKTDLKIAAWFASVNSWLRDQRPLDVIGCNPKAVISAAKVEVAPIDHG